MRSGGLSRRRPIVHRASLPSRLILRVARSEFGPERLLTDCCDSKGDVISALRGSSTDFDSYELSEYLEDWRELKKFWCPKKKCYDVTSITNGFPSHWEEDVRKEMKSFFEKVNYLLKRLKKCCLHLEKLEKKSAAFPDLYKLLIKKAGVERAWLDRFAEIRNSSWGKAHFDEDNEPLSYHTRDKSGMLVFHSIDQVFPGQDTIRAIPSENYKPKPLHFSECIKCHKVKFDISTFECPYKWCEHDHKGKCGDCAPTAKCATCGKSGCLCCFVSCSRRGCKHKMCNCSDFHGWKDSDRGGAPGCSYVAPSRNVNDEGSGDDDESDMMEKDEYCALHKPEGAVKHEVAMCVIM